MPETRNAAEPQTSKTGRGDDVYERVFQVAKRRGFLYPSFEIYGGVAGFYDYGPLGAAMKANMEALFRRVWVIGEGCAEISCPSVNPEEVFIASGHVAEFTDPMVTCLECKSPYRADHLIEAGGHEGGVPTTDMKRVDALIVENGVKCPRCGGPLSEAYRQNLMFQTEIGPGTRRKGYLRPETAQAMFMDFPALYRYFRERLPFGAIQFGRGYRNEISPRQGMLRLREFNMMEVEIFFDPEEGKKHRSFADRKDRRLKLVPARTEKMEELSVLEAIEAGLVKSEALAVYLVITQDYLAAVGLDPDRIRFRQHRKDEMAHYAADCWDAEFLSGRFGWVECVGLADRGSYDLMQHENASKVALRAMRRFDEPREVTRVKIIPHKHKVGPLFKQDAAAVTAALTAMDADAVPAEGPVRLEIGGRILEVPRDAFDLKEVTEKLVGDSFIPHVIEPSYGLDRILYASLEHSYIEEERVDEETGEREVYRRLRLPPAIAPVKVAVFPLVSKSSLPEKARGIERDFRRAGINAVYDDSGSIGRRYARQDEVGTPFCVTVDFDTIGEGDNPDLKHTVTVRERDSGRQHRVLVTALLPWLRERIEPLLPI